MAQVATEYRAGMIDPQAKLIIARYVVLRRRVFAKQGKSRECPRSATRALNYAPNWKQRKDARAAAAKQTLNRASQKPTVCVQQRLARSVGDSPTGVRVGAP
jgi:hypothetical protein